MTSDHLMHECNAASQLLTVSAAVIPGVTGKGSHVRDVIAITHQLLEAPVCFADVLSLKAVIKRDHGLDSIRLHASNSAVKQLAKPANYAVVTSMV